MSSVRRARRTTTALSAVVCAALVLGACGGGDDGTDTADDTPPGVDQSEPADDTDGDADEQDEPETEDEEDADRPEIDLGDDYEIVYDAEYTGDPVEDAILRDNEGHLNAVGEAMIHGEATRPAFTFYIAGQALSDLLETMDRIYDRGTTSEGTVRYFNRQVVLHDGGMSAAVTYCRDFSQVATVDRETGEVTSEPDTDAAATYYWSRVEQNEEGVWQTVEYAGEHDTEDCR
ncbi:MULTISPECIES: hypothetical protein [unclassified Streptomyces]|uniref:hypothetical protein n=1 Tax=unclassified Streptomyces TaxID=2593676 RepID=UPI000CD4EF7A|nr:MULTISPECIES: hypothetical protein [unclassified Streptomyces]